MEEQDVSQEYLRAFNRGYIMRKYKPDIKFKTMASSDKDAEALRGFEAGVAQYEKEINHTFDKTEGAFDKNLRQDKNIDMER